MKPNSVPSVASPVRASKIMVILGVAGLGYAAGWLTPKRTPSETAPTASTSASAVATAAATTSREPGRFRIPSEIERLVTGGTIHEAVYRIFLENDPVKRAAAFNLLLSTLTADNILEAKDSMFRHTQKTGKTAHNEWGLLMGRIGELLGGQSMAGNTSDRHRMMKGWATVNPDEALAFITTQPTQDHESLRNAWLYGVCRQDPARALKSLLSDPDFSKQRGGEFMKEAVQIQGLDGAQASLQQALDEAPGDVENSPIFQNLFIELTNAKLFRDWQSNTTQETCDWLEKQRGAPYLIEPLIGHAAYDLTWHRGPAATLDWLQRMDTSAGAARLPGISGFQKAIMEKPSNLSSADDAMLEKVVAQFDSASSIKILAKKLDQIDPAKAVKVRALGAAAEQRR